MLGERFEQVVGPLVREYPLYQKDEPAQIGPWSMTLADVVLGDEAKARIAEWSAANAEAPLGLAYAIALVAVENTGSTPSSISLADFRSVGADGMLRRTPAVVVGEGAMRGMVAPGDVLEGWIPLVVDDPSVATLWFESTTLGGNWGGAVFALTPSSAVPEFPIPPVTSSDLGASPDAPAELGQPVSTGGWAITLERILEGQDIYDMADFNLRALGDSSPADIPSWFAVYGSVINSSDWPAHFSSSMLEVADASGESWDHILALTPPSPDLSCDLLPGASHAGWAAFERKDYDQDGILDSVVAMIRAQPSRISDEPRYIRIADIPDTASDELPAEASPEARRFEPGDVVVVSGDPVNLRAAASMTGEIVAELPVGTQLTVSGAPIEADGYQWFPVEVNETGETGYVVQDYLAEP